jgi:hypothetical protein
MVEERVFFNLCISHLWRRGQILPPKGKKRSSCKISAR